MGCLHIVNKSPFDHQALNQCLECLGIDDSIILIEDAVVAASSSYFESIQEKYTLTKNIFVLEVDLDARGIQSNSAIIKKVDYAGFVSLVATHQNSLSWF